MPVFAAVGDRLIAAGIAGVTARSIDVFENNEPEATSVKDEIITLKLTQGEQTEMGFGSTVARTEFPRLQIIARGAKGAEDECRARLQAIIDDLIAVQATTLGGVLYQMIHCFNGPNDLGTDKSERPRKSANFRIEKDPG